MSEQTARALWQASDGEAGADLVTDVTDERNWLTGLHGGAAASAKAGSLPWTPADEAVYLIHAPLDMRAFNRWAGRRGFVRRGAFDPDFALHVLLSAMFGKRALQPFRLFWWERRRSGSLYAYTDADHRALQDIAAAAAHPDCLAPLDPTALCSKPMPSAFAAGRRLGFDLRARPVRRLRRDVQDSQTGAVARQGGKVDAFRQEGPDATLQGTLRVQDPETFTRRLREGVGRHRAYGYGMMLLRPPNLPAPAK